MPKITVALPICTPVKQQVISAVQPLQQKFAGGGAVQVSNVRNVNNTGVAAHGRRVAEADGVVYPVAHAVDLFVANERRAEWIQRELLKSGYRIISQALSKANARLITQRRLNKLPLKQNREGQIIPWSNGNCGGVPKCVRPERTPQIDGWESLGHLIKQQVSQAAKKQLQQTVGQSIDLEIQNMRTDRNNRKAVEYV